MASTSFATSCCLQVWRLQTCHCRQRCSCAAYPGGGECRATTHPNNNCENIASDTRGFRGCGTLDTEHHFKCKLKHGLPLGGPEVRSPRPPVFLALLAWQSQLPRCVILHKNSFGREVTNRSPQLKRSYRKGGLQSNHPGIGACRCSEHQGNFSCCWWW